MRLNLALLLAGASCLQGQVQPVGKISGPHTYENLSIFLIYNTPNRVQRGTQANTVRYTALQQAMEQKKVVVYETNKVNELSIENTSPDPIFIQRGDLVKGGNQDRMITNDFILPPKSGRLPLAAFCVEQSRWSKRENESAEAFSSSAGMGAVAFDPKATWNQVSVWNKVLALRDALASQLSKSTRASPAHVAAIASQTSLVLTQTSPPIEEMVGPYTKALASVLTGRSGVVGYVFAINGELKDAEVYASSELLSAMWPKLLKSSVIEAIRLRQEGKAAPVDLSKVTAFLHETDRSTETVVDVNRRTKLAKRENDRQVLVECRDGVDWVHRSLSKK